MGRDLGAKSFVSDDGLVASFEGDEELGLDLAADGGGELHLEVGQALIPRAWEVQLVGGSFGVLTGDGMDLSCCERGSVEGGRRCGTTALVDTPLDPKFSGTMVLPVGEQRDAVASAHDGFKIVLKLSEIEIAVYDLRHLVAGLHVEGDAGDHAQRSEANHGSRESVAVLGA